MKLASPTHGNSRMTDIHGMQLPRLCYIIIRYSMIRIDEYVLDTLMRDLVGHDRRPACFLVFLWILAEEQRREQAVAISYSELAENIGISKSSAQAAIGWLVGRKLLSVKKETVTATPVYSCRKPWKTGYRK